MSEHEKTTDASVSEHEKTTDASVSERVWADRRRDVVLVEGEDAGSFLHSQLAHDIAALEIGGSLQSLLLDPTGHVHSLVRVVRHGDSLYSLDTEQGSGPQVIERLRRFILRSRVTLTMSDWMVRAIRGDNAWGTFRQYHGAARPTWPAGLDENLDRQLEAEIDIVAPRDYLAEMSAALGDWSETEPEHIEALRVDIGWPACGVDFQPGDVPATTGIVRHVVSFTKGCYPGQELVERMDSRGAQAPVQLRRLDRGSLVPMARVSEAIDGVSSDVGTVTSVGMSQAIARVARGASVGEPLDRWS